MNHDDIKHVFDFGSIGALILTLFDQLPKIASIVAAGWIFLRVYDYVKYVRPQLKRGHIEDEE